MGNPSQVVLFIALLAFGFVSTFSITHRSARNTDLAEALAILQRQRRRVGVEDFLNSERLLEGRPLTLEDLNDWLGRANGNDVVDNEDWMTETGNYKDFEPSEVGYDEQLSDFPPTRIKASANEVNDIFADNEQKPGMEGHVNGGPEKKKKEELINVHGDKQTLNKPVPSTQNVEPGSEKDSSEALNSLTDEEVRVLMKAVGKLQQRTAGKSRGKKSIVADVSTTVDKGLGRDGEIISNPVSEEELEAVFQDTEVPVEDKITPEDVEHEIELHNEEIGELEDANAAEEQAEAESEAAAEQQQEDAEDAAIEEAAVAAAAAAEEEQQEEEEEEEEAEQQAEGEAEELAAENAVAEEIANLNKNDLSPELVSRYLRMTDNIYLPTNGQGAKRTAKRASGFYSNDLDKNDDVNDEGSLDVNDLDAPPLIQAFVAKILALQDEIDGLRFKNRLEELENDELTDALNEATVGQQEGTVSNEEWKSLQHAIEIEQALQDLKKKELSNSEKDEIKEEEIDDDNDEKRKRGEPWKRKRGREDNEVDPYGVAIASRSSSQDQNDDNISREGIERLLGSAYLMKDSEDRENEEEMDSQGGGNEDEPIASLFLSHADRCPAIQRYSNNCELADLYNLPVDFEARALCNLHEMCYACGHSLSVSQPQCDLVYRAAVSSLCHQKEVCVAESEIFLRTMKLKTRYIPHVQAACRSRCTAQFMGMF